MRNKKNFNFVLCIENKDAGDLQKRKVYQFIMDTKAEKEGFYRIVDDSGEDYLYPKSYFISIQIPEKAAEAILASY